MYLRCPGVPLLSSSHIKVQTLIPFVSQAVLLTDVVFIGAQHLYLIDFCADNLPDLKTTIKHSYPDVKASCEVDSQFLLMNMYRLQQFRLMLRMMLR